MFTENELKIIAYVINNFFPLDEDLNWYYENKENIENVSYKIKNISNKGDKNE